MHLLFKKIRFKDLYDVFCNFCEVKIYRFLVFHVDFKTTNAIQLGLIKNHLETYFSEDLVMLKTIANLCDLKFGPAVLTARELLGAYSDTLIVFYNDCDGPSFRLTDNEVKMKKNGEAWDIKIFPNPSKEFINFTSNMPVKSMEIFDLMGRFCLAFSKTQLERPSKPSISMLPKGTYIVTVTNYNSEIKHFYLFKE